MASFEAVNLSDVDCMTCLTNVARGLQTEDDWRVRWNGVIHAVVWDMSTGRVAPACKYERHNPYGSHVEWRQRKESA